MANGLAAFPCWQGNAAPRDLITGLDLPGTSGTDWIVTEKGPGPRLDAINEGFYAAAPASMKAAWPISLHYVVQMVSTPSNNANMIGVVYANPHTSPYVCWAISPNSTGKIAAYSNQSGSLVSLESGTTWPSSGIHSFSAVWHPGTTGMDLYYDGNLLTSGFTGGTTLGTTATYTATSTFVIGQHPNTGSRNSRCITLEIIAAQAAWTAEDIRYLHNNSFAAFRPDLLKVMPAYKAQVAGGGAFDPSSGFPWPGALPPTMPPPQVVNN